MNCIVIDDEPLARKGMALLIEKVPGLSLLADFPDALSAHAFIQKKNEVIDLLFLDIEMPGMNGLEFLTALPPSAMCILTTAYPQYALEAFELEVIDYLVKPIKLSRFVKAVDRARELKELQLSSVSPDGGDDFVYIKSDRKYVKLYYDNILFIKGLKDYVVIHADGQKFMTAMNIATTLKQLPDKIFARVSKSYIVNVKKIASIESDVIWIGKDEIPLGASYREDFIQSYVTAKLISR